MSRCSIGHLPPSPIQKLGPSQDRSSADEGAPLAIPFQFEDGPVVYPAATVMRLTIACELTRYRWCKSDKISQASFSSQSNASCLKQMSMVNKGLSSGWWSCPRLPCSWPPPPPTRASSPRCHFVSPCACSDLPDLSTFTWNGPLCAVLV